MNYILWNDKDSCGVEKIDNEHKALINIINDLNRCLLDNAGKAKQLETMECLLKKLEEHIVTEEEPMRIYDYKEKEFHTAEHMSFYIFVKDAYEKIKSENNELNDKMIETFAKRIYNHMVGIDKEYGEFLLENGYGGR